MTRFPSPRVLRKIPTGPNPPPSDLQTLLGSKLRVFFDTRFGGEFAPGVWTAHTDIANNLRIAAPTTGQRVLCAADGTNFKGLPVQRVASIGSTKLVNANCGDIVPAGSRPEIFMVARIVTFPVSFANLCGCANAGAGTNVGAQFYIVNASTYSSVVGATDLNATFSDTTAPHIFDSYNDGTNAVNVVDGNVISTAARGATVIATQQIAIGGFATGFLISPDAFVASWGIINPAMTSAERTRFNEILRNDWGF